MQTDLIMHTFIIGCQWVQGRSEPAPLGTGVQRTLAREEGRSTSGLNFWHHFLKKILGLWIGCVWGIQGPHSLYMSTWEMKHLKITRLYVCRLAWNNMSQSAFCDIFFFAKTKRTHICRIDFTRLVCRVRSIRHIHVFKRDIFWKNIFCSTTYYVKQYIIFNKFFVTQHIWLKWHICSKT